MTDCENFGLNAITKLVNEIDASTTVITINDVTGFPDPPFRIRIDDEYMLVTSVTGPNWTVTRAVEDSPATSHLPNALVANVLTKAGLFNTLACMSLSGDRASRPSPDPDVPGKMYFTTDPGWYIYSDQEGTEWSAFGVFFELFEPDETGFSWINQGSASTSTTDGGVVLTTPAPGGAGENVRLRVETAPATPYTLKTGLIPLLYPLDQTSTGLIFRESSTGKFVFFRLMYDTTSALSKTDVVLSIDKFAGSTSFDSNYKVISASYFKTPLIWLQIEDDGSDLIFSYSNDAKNYRTLDTRSRTDFLAGGPNQIGYAVNSNNTAAPVTLTLLSYEKS